MKIPESSEHILADTLVASRRAFTEAFVCYGAPGRIEKVLLARKLCFLRKNNETLKMKILTCIENANITLSGSNDIDFCFQKVRLRNDHGRTSEQVIFR